MFLSLFPFPEVASIIAICLAWVFIALGVMGNNQSADTHINTFQNEVPAQISFYQAHESFTIDHRTYVWQQVVKLCKSDRPPAPLIFYEFHSGDIIKFPVRQESLSNYYLYKNIPNRAPPAV